MKKPLHIFLVLLIAILGSVNLTRAGSQKISQGVFYGCSDRNYWDKIESYLIQEDREAFEKALRAGMIKETCVWLETGEEVFVVFRTSGLIKVRRQG